MIPLLSLILTAAHGAVDIQIDPLLLVEANEVWSVVGRKDNPVWPGWDARATPVLIYFPGKQDVLINHPHPPVGFQRYRGPLHCGIGPIWVKNGPTILDFDGQNTAIDVGGVGTLVIADTLSTRRQWVEGLVPQINANPADADRIVGANLMPHVYADMTRFAHEAFHVYQARLAPNKHPDEMALAAYPALSVDNNVGLALEAEHLAAALRAKSRDQVRAEAVAWLAARRWRRERLSPAAVAYEDGGEFLEGTAVYVEYRTLQYLQGRTPSANMWLAQGFFGYGDLSAQREAYVKAMQGFVSGTIPVNNDLYGASPVRFRLYYSGMAIGALLDRLGVAWHNPILKTNASLTSLAEQAVHPTVAELNSAIARMLASARYADLVKAKSDLRQAGEKYIDDEVKAFVRAPGRVVLDYSKVRGSTPRFGFTPFGILRVDDDRTIFRLVPISGKVGTTAFKEDGPRPVLLDRRLHQITVELNGPLDSHALLSQLKRSSLGDVPESASHLTLPGISLDNVKGRMRMDGPDLLIELE